MTESEVPSRQHIHGVSTQNHSQAFVGTARDVYLSASHNPQEVSEQTAVACCNALFLTDPYVDREKIISAKGTRAAGTCEWIKRNAEYCTWLNCSNNDQKRLLWISGGPGKGKTMLSVFLTEELERHAGRASNTDLIFLFCSAEDDKRNTSVSVLRGLVHQILIKRPQLAKHVLSYFEPKERAQQTVSSLETLWLMFIKLISDEELGTFFCVLDGLDECEESTLKVLLPRIVSVLSEDDSSLTKSTFKLVVVSREIPGLQSCARVRLDPDNDQEVASDIGLFVSSRVAELSRIEGFNEEFRTYTQKALLERAEGTFLWVGFAMHELSQKQTCTGILEALTYLPRGLPAIYSRMLHQIPAGKREVSQKILRWVAISVRPMTLQELSVAVGVQAASSQITTEQAAYDTAALCGPILKIQQPWVGLVHQSARDYLLRKEHDKDAVLEAFRFDEEKANFELAQECLRCITESGFQHRFLHLEAISGKGQSPLLAYATLHWPEHVRNSSMLAAKLFDSFEIFLQKKSRVRSYWWSSYTRLAFRGYVPFASVVNPPPLHMACYLEIMPWAKALLNKRSWRPSYHRRINKQDGAGETALHWAARWGSEAAVQFLVESGAEMEVKNRTGETALHLAVEFGNDEVVRRLVNRGANVKTGDRHGLTPLYFAVQRRSEAIVRILLARMANIDRKDVKGVTMLHHAAKWGNAAVVQQLIDRGWDVNAKRQGETVLHWAAKAGVEAIVRLLIDSGADIEARDFYGRTALHWAAEDDNWEIARLLVDEGADPKAKDDDGRGVVWAI